MTFIEAQKNEAVLQDVALGLAYADRIEPFLIFAVLVVGCALAARWLARTF